MNARTLHWFRYDLRLADNPALHHAAQQGAVLPVFIWDTTDPYPIGGASRWWLHHSLANLQKQLPVPLLKGDPLQLIPQLVQKHRLTHISWNNSVTPHHIRQEQTLQEQGIPIHAANGNLLCEPTAITTKQGTPYGVFTPFWKVLRRRPQASPLPPPTFQEILTHAGDTLTDWHLLPTQPNWAEDFSTHWQPGEQGALNRLTNFIQQNLQGYATLRDRPDLPHTSRLSPHLHWGEISPRTVWHHVQLWAAAHPTMADDADKFLNELAWREFSHHLLYHHPTLPSENLKPVLNGFPWRTNNAHFTAWQRGQTGYPLVDAGMRELWATGTMHNRVRMVVASFLIKHLGIHWQQGADWFWDTLVDADLPNNSASWQWVAGCGADAAPYFRVFNPTAQAKKFDPHGAYIRRWVPELSHLTAPHIFTPSSQEAPDYPQPLVSHAPARQQFLAEMKTLREV